PRTSTRTSAMRRRAVPRARRSWPSCRTRRPAPRRCSCSTRRGSTRSITCWPKAGRAWPAAGVTPCCAWWCARPAVRPARIAAWTCNTIWCCPSAPSSTTCRSPAGAAWPAVIPRACTCCRWNRWWTSTPGSNCATCARCRWPWMRTSARPWPGARRGCTGATTAAIASSTTTARWKPGSCCTTHCRGWRRCRCVRSRRTDCAAGWKGRDCWTWPRSRPTPASSCGWASASSPPARTTRSFTRWPARNCSWNRRMPAPGWSRLRPRVPRPSTVPDCVARPRCWCWKRRPCAASRRWRVTSSSAAGCGAPATRAWWRSCTSSCRPGTRSAGRPAGSTAWAAMACRRPARGCSCRRAWRRRESGATAVRDSWSSGCANCCPPCAARVWMEPRPTWPGSSIGCACWRGRRRPSEGRRRARLHGTRPRARPGARVGSVGAAAEFAGGGVDQDALAVGDVLRDHDLDAGAEPGRLRTLGRGATLELRWGLAHFQGHVLRQLDRHRLLVDHLHVDVGEAVGDVAHRVAQRGRVQGVGGVVLVVEEHEGLAVLVREAGQAAQQLDLGEVVIGIEAGIELGAAGHRIHDEAEAHVAAAALRRAALDVADLVHAVVVLDDVALFDVAGLHVKVRDG